MTITYSNGRSVEAALLSRTDKTLRVAIQGDEDATLFTNVNGSWVTEDCELAQIEFAWQQHGNKSVSEGDHKWSTKLAARLVQFVIAEGISEEEPARLAN